MATRPVTRREVSPVALGLLASGGYLVLAALITLSPFVLSPYAIQNDVYMGNLFISPPLLVLGGALVFVGLLVARLQGRMVTWKQGLVPAVVGSGLFAMLYVLAGGHYESAGPPATWPPYLNELLMIVTLVLGLAVFIMAWGWAELMDRQPTK